MKKILAVLLVVVFFNSRSNAQYASWYTVDPTHNCYSTAYTFSSDPDFIRGFCFAYDALGGHPGTVTIRTIEIGNTYPLTINIGMGIDSYTLSNYISSGWFYTAAYLLRENYLPTLTADPTEYAFYSGYIFLLEQAAYNPSILNLGPGQTV